MSDAPVVGRPAHVIAIVGPTAVGKSAVAEEVAVALGGEIVSADSMQVYRGMDIGTAKVPEEERRVPYHCVDVVEPGTPYSAARYQSDARHAIADIAARGRIPIVVGGTGLYVRAALDAFEFPGGHADTPGRAAAEELASTLAPEELHAHLAALDPASAALIHPRNVRRVVRAIEMADDGVSYATQAAAFAQREPFHPATYVGLTMERAALYARVDTRVDAMIAAGLLQEIRSLLTSGFRKALTAAQAIGYKELVPVVEDDASLEEAVAAIKRATRRYAKRQLTWFRADPRVRWLDVAGLSTAASAGRVLELLESQEMSGG